MVDAGGLSNQASTTASSPGTLNADVSDMSDDGDDTDGNTTECYIKVSALVGYLILYYQWKSGTGDIILY